MSDDRAYDAGQRALEGHRYDRGPRILQPGGRPRRQPRRWRLVLEGLHADQARPRATKLAPRSPNCARATPAAAGWTTPRRSKSKAGKPRIAGERVRRRAEADGPQRPDAVRSRPRLPAARKPAEERAAAEDQAQRRLRAGAEQLAQGAAAAGTGGARPGQSRPAAHRDPLPRASAAARAAATRCWPKSTPPATTST